MIYEKHNFTHSFSNATGDSKNRMSIHELGKTIKNHPKEVMYAITDANIKISPNANQREIIKTILSNKRNKQMIQNISAIIFASSSFDGNYSNLDEGAVAGADKGKFMEQIGTWFKAGKEKRQKRRADATASGKPTFLQRVGGFFSKNKEGIAVIGGSLYDGLQTKSGAEVLDTQGSGTNSGNVQPTFFEKNKMYIIGAVVLIGGFFVYKKFIAKGK